jgi:hypothetical protein
MSEEVEIELALEASSYKIAVVIRQDLEPWKRLNVASFTISGVAAQPSVVGEPYVDASGQTYLPMFNEPVLVFGANAGEMARTAERATSRGVVFCVFTDDLFETFNDVDNRAAVARVATKDLSIAGMAFRTERKTADKILKGLKFLK